jgi:hypothetical protein
MGETYEGTLVEVNEMNYLKLWKYALCPFYINFAPYIIMSLVLGNLMGCTGSQVPKIGECFYDLDLYEYNRNIYQVKEIGTLGLKAINNKGTEYIFYSKEIQKDHFIDCFDLFECYKNVGVKDETCKLPRAKESKASPSPSKNQAK